MPLTPGTCLGPYEIVGWLGAGGMGEVYRARDTRLGRDVAVKVLPERFAADPEARERLAREARAASSLNHPNICTVHDVGHQGAADYVVMEFLEGETLRMRLDRTPLPWTKAAEIGAAIADGLAAAHARSIVHRDLTPRNVFLTSDGRVKILDFGLARLGPTPTLDGSADAATQTVPVAIVGTAGYMSPEQVRGERVGAHGDLFALGCVLHEMVAGRAPFARPTTLQTLNAILESDPPPLRESGRDVPAEMDRLISRCLLKDPALRMQSAHDLSFALGEILRRTGPIARRVERRNRARFGLTILALVAALAIAALAVGPLRSRFLGTPTPERIESLAVLPLENLSGDAAQDYFADGMTEALITDLGKIGGLRVSARPSVMKYRGTPARPEEIARDLRVQALVVGSVMRSEGRVRITAQLIDPRADRQIWSESYERDMRDVLALQREVTQAIAGEVRAKLTSHEQTPLGTPRPVDPGAYDLFLRAQYLGTRTTTDADNREAIAMLEQAIALDPNFAPAHAGLAAAYVNRLNFVAPEQAGELEQKAYAASERALSLDPKSAEAYLARGLLQWTPSLRFAHERAIQEFRRALSLNPNLDRAHEGLSRVLVHVGFFDEALRHSAEALAINPTNALAVNSRAEALLWSGRNDEAFVSYSSLPGSVVPELVEAHSVWALSRMGRDEEAWSRLREALREYPDDSSGVLWGMEAMLLSGSEPTTAEERIGRVARRKAFGPSHHAAYFVGCAWARMGRPDAAVQWLREAAETGFPCYPLYVGDATLDPIRGDPRFVEFLADVRKQSESLRKALFPDSG